MSNCLERKRTQNLLLLVGTNPLPNLVAATLLVEKGGRVFLIRTKGKRGTGIIADRLKDVLVQLRPDLEYEETRDLYDGFHIIPREVSETNAVEISCVVEDILKTAQGTIGSNYTGGTKPMAVHVYETVKEKKRDAVMSYLDARTLQMVIEPNIGPGGEPCPVGNAVQVTIPQLLQLHGYHVNQEPDEEGKCFRQTPYFFGVAKAIRPLFDDKEHRNLWYAYLNTKDLNALPDASNPIFDKVNAAFRKLAKTPTAPTPDQVAVCFHQPKFSSLKNFFRGGWLEEYTLGHLRVAAKTLKLEAYGIDLRPHVEGTQRRAFQLDLAALFGYQFFAISCMVSKDRQQLKDHLFEVSARAQQLGGEEARCALVCTWDNAYDLEQEIKESWDAEGKVRVFGRQQLENLCQELAQWIQDENRPNPK